MSGTITVRLTAEQVGLILDALDLARANARQIEDATMRCFDEDDLSLIADLDGLLRRLRVDDRSPPARDASGGVPYCPECGDRDEITVRVVFDAVKARAEVTCHRCTGWAQGAADTPSKALDAAVAAFEEDDR